MARKVTFSRFDAADHLKTEEDVAAYLDAVMEEGGDDPAFVTHALGNVARARNMAQLARDAGMTRQGLYKALSGEGDPSFANVMKIANALGLKVGFHAEPPRHAAAKAGKRSVDKATRKAARKPPSKRHPARA